MAVAKKRKLNPGPVAKAAERAHSVRLGLVPHGRGTTRD